MFKFPDNITGDSWEELGDFVRHGASSAFEIAEIILEYLDKDLAISRKHPEIFEDDPQSELTLEIYNKLKRAFDKAVSMEESCTRKPIPEDMTIPLFIKGENFPEGKVIEDASILDIAPTITDILGVKKDKDWEGKSLYLKA